MPTISFSACIRESPDGGYSVQATHTILPNDTIEDEQVLDWIHCDTYDEATELITRTATERGVKWNDIEWRE